MSVPLLTTKLHVPPVRPELVPRPRLVEQLQAALHRKLTLISAPAGFGKTTLLSEWVHGRAPRPRVAWLSLDGQDSEAARFWTYLIAALQTVQAGLGQAALPLLQSPQPPSAGQGTGNGAERVRAGLTPLLNDIAALDRAGLVLILDDYHHISDPAIHEGVAFLIDHLPHNVHVMIATRADPPLPTFRLRARGQLTELRSDDLRFATDEAATFLNSVMGLDLAAEDIEALEARTEGWIVGLQLAALSLQGRADAQKFVTAFSGSHHYVLEYLTEEVVRRQPEPVQRFLMETSILERLCGSLCDAVCLDAMRTPAGGWRGEAMLAHLQGRNLFIVALDDERRWYRYHHLFSDLLANLLRKEQAPEQVYELHRRASEWYEQNGSPDDAIKHALRAQDYERAATLIEQGANTMLSHGRLTKLLGWINRLPPALLQTRLRLRLFQGWALHLSGQTGVAQEILLDTRQALQARPPSPENEALRGQLAALLAAIATLHEERDRVIQEAQEALTYLPDEDRVSRARVYVSLGTAYAYDGDMEAATRTWHQAKDLAFQAGNLFLGTAAIEMLVGTQIFHLGRLREAEKNLQQVLELGTTPEGLKLPFTATAHALLAEIHLEWNDLDAAAEYVETAIELLQRGGIGYGMTHTYCTRARLAQARGDRQGALEAMETAARATEGCPLWHMVLHQAACQVRLSLCLDDVATAARWAQGDPATMARELPANLPAYLREVQTISLARVYLARGETAKVLATLDRWRPQAQDAGRQAQLVEMHLLEALARQAQDEPAAALAALQQSLALAESEGYTRLFLEVGESLAPLLREAAKRGPAAAYARNLLAASGESAPDDPQVTEEQGPSLAPALASQAEALTRRELEVLRLICEGCSNRQISERLVVTLNTVKKHSSNIYGKLGVTSRAQAIVRARELGLC